MAKKTLTKDMPEWQFFADLVDFYRNYGTPEDNEAYFESVLNKIGELGRKYNNDGMVVRVLRAMWDSLEAQLKGGK